ncbi:metallophosphoesterase [Oceanobacillus manasiensis]|uniref:metallophosphoesterase n=1 Tax=Oceanobacillus manasiensis TaxID=586413 RepID=UPI0005A86E31|nr:metallophosphoesterase [Oceanobacillus manasiensis]
MNRRSFIKRSIGSLLALIGIGGGTYYYARDIEPRMLQVQNIKIIDDTLPASFNKFKLVQFSDTHIGFHYSVEQLRELVKKINSMKPDLIVFTGDLVDEPHRYSWNNNLINVLNSLEASQGKYWIYGNHDHGGYGTEKVKEVMEASGFALLQNEHSVIELNNERIILSGIDDVMLGRPDLGKALENVNPDLFTLLLAHEPDFVETAVDYPVNVQLSGHSHGGQVRLPFIGHLYTPKYAEKYVEGKYLLDDGRLQLFVNRGIGTTRLPYRLFCKPELHVYTLHNE